VAPLESFFFMPAKLLAEVLFVPASATAARQRWPRGSSTAQSSGAGPLRMRRFREICLQGNVNIQE